MDLNLKYETVKINKIIFNKNLEQSIEFSYQLPDYYTGIFKVLQFELEPVISSCRASNKQFLIDGNAKAKLIYIDEEGGNVKSIHQNIPFSRTIDLNEEALDSVLYYNLKTNYKNCKIISPKKIEIKANLILSVKILSQKEENFLMASNEKTIQFRQVPIYVTKKQIWASQQFKINEQLELKTVAKDILDVKINLIDDETKLISNKIISKSIANIEILYCDNETNSIILQKTSLPINNILDMPDINEKYLYNMKYDVIYINFEMMQEGKILNIEADAVVNGYASLSEKINIIVDSFSTKYEVDLTKKEFNSSTIVSVLNSNVSISDSLQNINMEKIFDINANILDLIHIVDDSNNKIKFKAKLNLNILGENKEKTIEAYTKSIPIEFFIHYNENNLNGVNINIDDITFLDIDYSLTENLNFKINFNLKGYILNNDNISTLSEILIDETKIKEKQKAALTLFYPKVGDKIWNIAKYFCTSPQAIAEANNLQSDVIQNETMLIIPII